MNKTLLLIICDFLLLNLLALTRWEKAEPHRPALQTTAPTAAANAPAVNADLVELMRVSLEEEKAARDRLAAQMASTQGTLGEREKALAQLGQQKAQIESALASSTANVKELEKKYSEATNDAFLTKEALAKLQRELEENKADNERQRQALAEAERRNAEARKRIENLNFAIGAAEREKQVLTANLSEAKQQIEVERAERAKVQEQAAQLTQNVGTLAEQSGQLTKEVRDIKPVNPNAIFADFLGNRVNARISTRRPGLFGASVRDRETQTIFVTDGQRTYALMHLDDTPFSFNFDPSAPPQYERITGSLTRPRGPFNAPVKELDFLAADPRIIVVPVDESVAAQSGARIYKLATDVFKTSDALLVRADGSKYGETPFRIDSANPGYVKVDNRIVTRLFGEFAPKRGDLMFNKRGDLIGIMVNNDYCAVISSFTPSQTLPAGEEVAQSNTGPVFMDLAARWQRLPYKLQ
jgi:predicted  nucleic acid-binding Zn-ribbon protein